MMQVNGIQNRVFLLSKNDARPLHVPINAPMEIEYQSAELSPSGRKAKGTIRMASRGK